MIYIILDPFGLHGKVSNNLNEKLDKALVALKASIYGQQHLFFHDF